MRRYVVVALVTEVVGIICLWLYSGLLGFGKHQAIAMSLGWPKPGFTISHIDLSLLRDEAEELARQLDLLDNAFPFLVGFPAITVFALWTWDRQRKQKKSA